LDLRGVVVENEEEGRVFGTAAHDLDALRHIERHFETCFLADTFEEQLRVPFLGARPNVVGCASFEGVAGRGWCPGVEPPSA